jgi:hypothetical protein
VQPTPSDEDVTGFISATFRSVWALEVLLFLKQAPERSWDRSELVAALRASDSVIAHSVDGLLAAGLAVSEGGRTRYGPASVQLARLVHATEAHYAQRPDATRRLIILPRHDGLSAFADAFRLRKD